MPSYLYGIPVVAALLLLGGCVSLSEEERALAEIEPPSLMTCLSNAALNVSLDEYQTIADWLNALRQQLPAPNEE